jgi:acyl-CoA thioesterase-1
VRAESILKVMVAAALVAALGGCKADDASKSRSTMSVSSSPVPASSTMETHSEPEKVPEAAQARDERPVIVCFGDSITAGYGLDYEETYPADLQADLDRMGYHYRVVNAGISGDTTKDGLARVDRVIAMKPAIVVVEFGGNDGLRGIPISQSRGNLDAILQKLRAGGTQIALAGITLPPQYGPDYIQQFNATYALLAKKYRVPMIPFVLQNAYWTPGDIQRDGIHPTAAGAKVVAENVLKLVRPLLKKPA